MKSANRFVLAYFANQDQAWDAFRLLDGGAYAAFLVAPARGGSVPTLHRKRDPRLFIAAVLGLVVLLGSLLLGVNFAFAAAGFGCLLLASQLYIIQNATLARAIRQRYGRTILNGETLVAVEVAPDRFPGITRMLRTSDPPAIFVVSDIEDLKNHGSMVKGQGLQLAPAELRQSTEIRAVALASTIPAAASKSRRAKSIARVLSRAETNLDFSVEELNIGLRLEYSVSPAAEWLLDNAHLVRSQIAEVRRGLTPEFLLSMPGTLLDSLRIHDLASVLAVQTDGVITQENVTAVLSAADLASHLNIAEIWAFPQFLRLVLVDRLQMLASRIVRAQHQQELAYFFADRIIAATRRNSGQVDEFLALYYKRMGGDLRSFGLLAKQLQDEYQSLNLVQAWLSEKHNYSLADDLPEFHKSEALDRISVSNIMVSFRRLSSIDFVEVFEAVNQVEALLQQDPTGTYNASDFATRDQYRMAIEELARNSIAHNELQVARKALDLAKAAPSGDVTGEVGYYLIDDGRQTLESQIDSRPTLHTRILRALRKNPTQFYLTALALVTALLLLAAFSTAISMSGIHSAFVLVSFALLLLLPLSEIATQLMQALVVAWMPVDRLPRLSLEHGIPDAWATLVAVPMMLQSEQTIDRELLKLEIRYLANRDANLYFALIGDFVDAAQQVMPADSTLLDHARLAIEKLNARFQTDRFSVFHRERMWCKTEAKWIGWERKRGKLEELNAFLLGCPLPHHSIRILGALTKPIQYVITLDADTLLPVGTGRAMIETIAHPLNRTQADPAKRLAQRGYTIIQPRVSIGLPEALATRFTRLFSDISGSDPYARPVSDAYQDLFGHGIFHGKAIYDVRAFHELTSGRFPEDRILSHDLIEGEHVRVGLASDIEIFESFPTDYPSYCKRQHRWIRGDWQIAAWIRNAVPNAAGGYVHNPLPPISRWKIFDNLRRSLVAPAATLLVAACWVFGAGVGIALAVILGFLVTPFFIGLLTQVSSGVTRDYGYSKRLTTELKRILISLILLPHQALISVDAIVRACYRMTRSQKHLLEWETAEATQADPALHLNRSIAQGTAIMATVMSLLVIVLLTQRALWTVPILVLWLLTSETIRALGQREEPSAGHLLSKTDQTYLRLMARTTWRFFDDLVGPDDNWLPPDNYQESPNAQTAHRTSPTNIGLWITCLFAAKDLGHLTADALLQRLAATLKTIAGLEKYRGHLLNWYDTRSTQPLLPRYVSTADSGNLLASMIVAVAGLKRLIQTPIAGAESLRALDDHLRLIQGLSAGDTIALASIKGLARLVRGGLATQEYSTYWKLVEGPIGQLLDSTRWTLSSNDQRSYWIAKLHTHAEAWNHQCDRYLHWRELLLAPPNDFVAQLGPDAVALRKAAAATLPSLHQIALGADSLRGLLALRQSASGDTPQQALHWLEEIEAEYDKARAAAEKTIHLAHHCVEMLEQFIEQTNLATLYDTPKKLLRIGIAIDMPTQSDNHYDLLASEARLASFIGIAKGDLPAEHWVALGRPYTSSDGQVLLSWSGTMFEYLMPALFMRNVDNSLLDNACRQAVRKQIEFGEQAGVPWGLSESGHSAVDANKTYQYYAFGVPGLSLKARVEQEVVVSPYSSALALQIDAPDALTNLKDLEARGLYGRMGFFEAIDFTREKGRGLGAGVLVQSYMAHHQGMSLMAIDNVLHHDIMQRRFHSDPRIRAVETLLYERIPSEKSRLVLPEPDQPALRVLVNAVEPTHRVTREDTSIPRAHLLANGRMALMLTNAGSGYCRWNDFDITRWTADTTLDGMGTYCYIRNVKTGQTFSATYQPTHTDDESYSAVFSADRVEFSRLSDELEVSTEITVSAEDDAEIRRYSLTNRTLREITIELTTYSELAMAPHLADRTHPAFSKMFVTTELLKDRRALIASRRPRSGDDPPLFAACVLAGIPASDAIEYETDRASFLGRDGNSAAPAALARPLNGRTGIVLDPVFSQRCRLVLKPRTKVIVSSVLMVANTREALLRLIDKYKVLEASSRAFELAWTHAQLELRYLGIRNDAAHRFQELASHLLYPNARIRAAKDRLERNTHGQSALWKYGISGDLPIAVITIADIQGIGNLRELLTAHTFWRLRGLKVDLVILNQESPSYDRPLADRIRSLVGAQSILTGMEQAGGVWVRAWADFQQEELDLLLSAARIVIRAGGGLLIQQLGKALEPSGQRAVAQSMSRAAKIGTPGLGFEDLAYFNGRGGFSRNGQEYTIFLKDGEHTPLPWVNVMANRGFGTMVSEAGLGATWSGNSQMNRLTPWNNDPVSGPPSDILYIRDEESGEFWTVTPQPIRDGEHYRVRHGHGYTIYEHNCKGIEHRLEVYVPSANCELPSARIAKLTLRNGSGIPRRLTVSWYVEWTLGTHREDMQAHVVTIWDSEANALWARNAFRPIDPQNLSYMLMTPAASSFTGDRGGFLGRNGGAENPAGLRHKHLDRVTGSGLDPCGALQVEISLDAGQSQDLTTVLGEAPNLAEVRKAAEIVRDPARLEECSRLTRAFWEHHLNSIQVHTPVDSIDYMINGWLLYQVTSCRLWGRTALYQSGGAFGFRDQLQDVMALCVCAPQIARDQILLSASRQFVEGDVQHWWHSFSGAGVRTRCSDDFLWLVQSTCHYIQTTGDSSILDQQVAFLDGRRLRDDELEAYFTPEVSVAVASLEVHCERALAHANLRGPHGLPLIGTGDWNDALNHVGPKGVGESVWLSWFLADTLQRFAALKAARGHHDAAASYRETAAALAQAVDATAWDGEWYLRAFFDTGESIGSSKNEEARIDSIAQSWSVISGHGSPDRRLTAMNSVYEHLVREHERIILLFDPPFDHSLPHPGYIMGYPPGLRENGGQYTHAAIWVAMAAARLGDGGNAVRLMQLLNPIESSRSEALVNVYKGEPYAVAADVYNAKNLAGRAGWTWYTGSASWTYRVWVEEILGFQVLGDRCSLQPVIPADWPGFTLTYRHGEATYSIEVKRDETQAGKCELDGAPIDPVAIPLVSGGEHRIVLWLAAKKDAPLPDAHLSSPVAAAV